MELTSSRSAVTTSRRRKLRERTVDEIKTVAVRIVERDGAAALSMREIAREMATAPSALYRYFEGRDALLSALIADAYDELGAVTEAAVGTDPGIDPRGAWTRAARVIRGWALANPSRWGLIYGTPIPGYAADAELTNQPAMRSTAALTGILAAGRQHRSIDLAVLRERRKQWNAATRADIARTAERLGYDVPAELLAEGIAAWSQLIGVISFEIFDHLTPLLTDPEPFFERQLERITGALPFAPQPRRPHRRSPSSPSS